MSPVGGVSVKTTARLGSITGYEGVSMEWEGSSMGSKMMAGRQHGGVIGSNLARLGY